MEKIKRYTFQGVDAVSAMLSNDKGMWVRHSDYEAQMKELLEILTSGGENVHPRYISTSHVFIKQIFAELGIEKGSEG